MTTTRRSFITALGAFAAMPLLPRTGIEPDLILYNGNFWTADDRLLRAQALAIADGRIFALGSNNEIFHDAGPCT